VRKAVVDTSVLISAVLFPASLPGRLSTLADQGRFGLHFSPIIYDEFRTVLRREKPRKTYGYADADIEAWCEELNTLGKMITALLPKIASVCRDPDDDHVIAAALAVKAGWIVTGD